MVALVWVMLPQSPEGKFDADKMSFINNIYSLLFCFSFGLLRHHILTMVGSSNIRIVLGTWLILHTTKLFSNKKNPYK